MCVLIYLLYLYIYIYIYIHIYIYIYIYIYICKLSFDFLFIYFTMQDYLTGISTLIVSLFEKQINRLFGSFLEVS